MEKVCEVSITALNDLSSDRKQSGSSDESLLRKYQRRLNVELAGLCVLMVIVLGLLTLPIIYYYLPVEVASN